MARGVLGVESNDPLFINILKSGGSRQSSQSDWPSILDANGYPISSPSGDNILHVCILPHGYEDHTWVLRWDGTGPLYLSHNATTPRFTVTDGSEFVNGSTSTAMTTQGADGRIEFTFNAAGGQTTLNVSFLNGATYSGLANVVLMRLDHEAAYDAGEIFNPDYIARITAMNPGVLRFLGANLANTNNASRHAYRHPLAAFTWTARLWVPGLWAGAASGTDTYTCSAATDTPGSWTDGETIHVQFPNANTSSTPTLDVGSRGAKTIVSETTGALSAGNIAAGARKTFVYDAALDKLIMDRTSMAAHAGIVTGLPIEVHIALCNKLGMGFWYNFPSFSDLASVTATTELVRDTLDSGLEFYPEVGNEWWNSGSGFPMTSWAGARGAAIGFPDNNNRRVYGFYALKVREWMEAVGDTWGSRGGLKRVLAFQGRGPQSGTNTYRIQGADLTLDVNGAYTTTAEDIVTNYTGAGERPVDFVEVLSHAPYFSGVETKNFDSNYTSPVGTGLLDAADDFDSDDPARIQDAFDWLDADIRDAAEAGVRTLSEWAGLYADWNTIAVSHGKVIIPYEFATEFAAPSESRLTALSVDTAYSAKIAALIDAYKKDWRYYKLVRDTIQQFMSHSQSERPCWFLAFGTSQWSATGQEFGADEADDYRSYEAVLHNNNGLRRWRARLT